MMIPKNRFVIDTNIIISRLLKPASIPGKAFQKAFSMGTILISEEVLQELMDVLWRKKFDPYLTIEDRQDFLRHLSFNAQIIPYVIPIRACRDPKDDKILSLAISGYANIILTGDNDLLVLDPFQNIRILTCLAYVQEDFSLGGEPRMLKLIN